MKEDVLEQIVDDYLQFKGYFTTHNVRFKPDAAHPDYIADLDRVPSDVDVVALHPTRTGPERVLVVTCKSWQTGFNPRKKLMELRENSGPRRRPTWQHFRELWIPKWAEAFRNEIARLTGQDEFAYRIAITRFQGDSPEAWAEEWHDDPTVRTNLPGCSIGFLTLEEMWTTLLTELRRTPAASEIGRLAQLLKAAGLTAEHAVAAASEPAPGSDAAAVAAHEEEEDAG
jgi:hypothetical protein